MHRPTLLPLLTLLCIGLLSCGGGDGQASGSSAKKDRGSASMELGDTHWEAERGKAKIKGETLRLSFTTMNSVDGATRRDELKLVITDYKGPGTYTVGMGGSMFVSVTLNANKAKDKEVTAALKDSLEDSRAIILMNAQVVIESADDEEIRGSFAWQSTTTVDPSITGGKFRAILDQ